MQRGLFLQLWNNGENHVVFNLYAGTWPDYNETQLGFPLGKAILAKASMSVEQYRSNFDVSIPLFHGTHPDKGDDAGTGNVNEFPSRKKYLIAFKGKVYQSYTLLIEITNESVNFYIVCSALFQGSVTFMELGQKHAIQFITCIMEMTLSW